MQRVTAIRQARIREADVSKGRHLAILLYVNGLVYPKFIVGEGNQIAPFTVKDKLSKSLTARLLDYVLDNVVGLSRTRSTPYDSGPKGVLDP